MKSNKTCKVTSYTAHSGRSWDQQAFMIFYKNNKTSLKFSGDPPKAIIDFTKYPFQVILTQNITKQMLPECTKYHGIQGIYKGQKANIN